jgi:hypothetical protein
VNRFSADPRVSPRGDGYTVTRAGTTYQVLPTKVFGWVVCTADLDFVPTSGGGLAIGFPDAEAALTALLHQDSTITTGEEQADDAGAGYRCSECHEPAVNQPPTAKPWAETWTGGHGQDPPAWSHQDGQPLCPVMGEHGYQPAQPEPLPTVDTPAAEETSAGEGPHPGHVAAVALRWQALGEPAPMPAVLAGLTDTERAELLHAAGEVNDAIAQAVARAFPDPTTTATEAGADDCDGM